MEQDRSAGIFCEVQRFRQVWVLGVVVLLAGLAWYAAVGQLVGHPLGSKSMPVPALVILWVLAGILLPAFFWASRLITEVRADGLYVRFVPFHWSFQRIPFVEIRKCEARRYRPLLEYGGWGIRYGPGGKAYNVHGNQGVQLELSNGKRLLIGSQRADELSRAIQAGIGREEPRPPSPATS
jgi:hypothetical protein